jgi:signal transduction histidine kinase
MNKQLKQSNAKLIRTQNELVNKEKLSAIGRFSAGIAHEINTPLGYIKSNLYTLSKYYNRLKENLQKYSYFIEENEKYIPDKQSIKDLRSSKEKLEFMFSDFDEITKETNEGFLKISNIISNLIRFSNQDMYDAIQLNSFNEILEETFILLNTELKDKKLEEIVELKINLADEELVKCNRFEIEHVIFNILINAVYFLNKKDTRGNISVNTYLEDLYFCCDIQDNGPGIKVEHINKIFDPFFTTKEIGEGIGLGLSICYDIIVNKHKGILSVKSVFGEGCTFYIKIPR